MVRTKVFVGNLAFTTKEPELAAAFGAAGKVIGANIITRGPRSLGYGFVEMESEEDAKKAVDVMNKKELNGRQINVEVAKPQEEVKEKEPRPQGENGAAPRGRGGRGRGGRRQGYQKRSPGAEGEGQKAEEKAEEGEKGDEDEGSRRRPRRRNRGGRVGQKRVAEESKEESKTTLFVANLPFGLDDDGFAKVVGELGLKPKSAHVVKKRNGRSKGYGFVEFENEADQKKALDGLNKKVVDSRELSVKVALTEQPKEEEEEKPA
jgi:RNA recognition motif-containing protein